MRKSVRIALAAAITSLAAPVFAAYPQSGLWNVTSEVNGAAGRGMQIDWQEGDKVVVSYYGYRADGSATFYLARAVTLDGKKFTGDLTEYKNGTVIGGDFKNGEIAQKVGTLTLDFDTETTGTVTLPGDKAKKISRFVYEDNSDRLYNSFMYTFIPYEDFTSIDAPSVIRVRLRESGNIIIDRDAPEGYKCTYNGDIVPQGNGFSSTGTVVCPLYTSGSAPAFYKFTNMSVNPRGILNAVLTEATDKDFTKNVNVRQLIGVCFRGATSGPTAGGANRCTADSLGMPEPTATTK